MKNSILNIFNKLFLGILFLGMISCEDDLDIYSESAISPEQINEENIQFFLNGLYESSTYIRDNYVFNDIRGGNYTWTALSGNNSSYGLLITGNGVDDSNSFSSSIWQFGFKNIYNSNVLIDAAQRLDKKEIEAEGRFFRAFMYYQLVTIFVGVPIIEENTVENIARNEAAEVWQFILNDLDFAIANGREFQATGNGRASIQMAKALKARVLLALDQKENAGNLAVEIINETGLVIDPEYDRIFRATNESTEILFAFKNLQTETNVRMSSLFWPYGTAWAGSYFVQPSDEVLNSVYEENDIRREVNIQTIVNSDGSSNTIVSKYWDVQPLIVSRISEIYLIAAEGKGLTQEGLNYLNELRAQRNVPTYELSDFTGQEDFLNAVLMERQRELYSEGFLFYDLVRTNKAIELPNIANTDQYLMPIPGSQINLSNNVLTQNPGY